MKRVLTVALAVLLLLSGGCTKMSDCEPMEGAALATEPTNATTQLQTTPQETFLQEQTDATQMPTILLTQPTKPSQSAHPTHPTGAVQTAQPTQPTQPTQVMQPIQTTQPAQTEQPTHPTQLTQPAQTIQLTQPAQPTQPAKPTQAIQPTQLTQAIRPTQPTQPTQPKQPTYTTQATLPTQGTQPTRPTQMVQHTQPTPPTQPTEPTQSAPQNTQVVIPETLPPSAPTEAKPQPTQTQAPTVQPTQTQAPTVQPTQSEETQVPTTQQTLPEQMPDTVPVTQQPEETVCQHDYQQTYTKVATCTAEGSKKFTCKKCGAVMRQQIPVKAHSYAEATCLKPKTCTVCACTEGAALGHSYDEKYLCIRCGAKDPAALPDTMPVDFAATIRSDEGVLLAGVTVTVYTEASGANSAGSAVTNQKGEAIISLSKGSSKYTVVLSNVPEEYQAQASYNFSSPQVTINLKSVPVRTDPNDHSKARYAEGDIMMEFTMTDVDGKTYQLSQLLKENKLVILDFWYVSCEPCKGEFPYFEAALEAYGEDVVLLAVDPYYSAEDIRQLQQEMGLSFAVFQDPLCLSGGFRVESYPTTVFIDSTGKIRRIHRGAFSDEAAFLKAVAAYL